MSARKTTKKSAKKSAKKSRAVPLTQITSKWHLVAEATYTGTGKITLTIKKPLSPPLWVERILISSASTVAVLDGKVTPGTSTSNPGLAQVIVTKAGFQTLLQFVITGKKLKVRFVYHSVSLTIYDIELAYV